MKFLILTTSHPYKAAGIVAIDLYKTLKSYGHEIQIITKAFDRYNDENIVPINSIYYEYFFKLYRLPLRIYKALLRILFNYVPKEKTNSDYAMLSINLTIDHYSTKKIMQRMTFIPDAIIVLFMPDFLTFKNLYELNGNTKATILLYMMDMAPMTGGCHYAWDCIGYTKNCGKCPGMLSSDPNDQTHLNWKFKKEYIDKTNIIPIAGTEWQYKQLKESSLFKNKQKYKILLSISPDLFFPTNKSKVREKFNLPHSKKIIFFGAVSIDEKRKGFKELIQALKIFNKIITEAEKENIHLIIAGKKTDNFNDLLDIPVTYLGYLNQEELPAVYQAADLFIAPSIEDSGPMMINQSIMCGTPVVAFEMGVALDLVITRKTGYRAKLKDNTDLAEGIKYILELSKTEYDKMSENCRDLGLELLHPQKQVQEFIDILQTNGR